MEHNRKSNAFKAKKYADLVRQRPDDEICGEYIVDHPAIQRWNFIAELLSNKHDSVENDCQDCEISLNGGMQPRFHSLRVLEREDSDATLVTSHVKIKKPKTRSTQFEISTNAYVREEPDIFRRFSDVVQYKLENQQSKPIQDHFTSSSSSETDNKLTCDLADRRQGSSFKCECPQPIPFFESKFLNSKSGFGGINARSIHLKCVGTTVDSTTATTYSGDGYQLPSWKWCLAVGILGIMFMVIIALAIALALIVTAAKDFLSCESPSDPSSFPSTQPERLGEKAGSLSGLGSSIGHVPRQRDRATQSNLN